MYNERSSYSLVFLISRTKPKVNGECPIYLKININGDKTRFPVKRHIQPKDWDSTRTRMKGRTKEAEVFNNYLDAIKLRANKLYNDLLATNAEVTSQMLKDAILGTNEARPRTIIPIWEDHVERLRSLIGKETTYTNMQKFRTAMRHFQEFLKKEYRVSDVGIKQIDHRMIESFGHFLKTEKGCSYNTATKFLQNLKKIMTDCIRNGWLLKNPFANISLTMKDVSRPYLSEEELNRLMAMSIRFDRLDRVRDLFLFACFTGLSYADVKKLKRSEIEITSEGVWIKTKRQKTGGTVNVPLLEVPWKIIQKHNPYFDELESMDPVLPIMSNQKMNAYLKEIADLAGISKSLSYHIARHTFATTVTMLNGVPIESVSKMLGHKNIKSTQHYARIIDQKVSNDMKVLSSKIDGKMVVNWG
jgi:site-specific recombinase XerD